MTSNRARIVVYDAMETGPLGASWRVGAAWWRRRGATHTIAATSWSQVFDDIGDIAAARGVDWVQFWGHGAPGAAYIGRDVLTERDVLWSYRYDLEAIGVVSVRPSWWFRTCSTAAGKYGPRLLRRIAQYTGGVCAAHLVDIGFPWHRGLVVVDGDGRMGPQTDVPTWQATLPARAMP